MSYAEAFAEAMAGLGVPVDAGVVPDQGAVNSDFDALGAWLSSLDEDTHAAIDLVTAENPIQAGLADQSVGHPFPSPQPWKCLRPRPPKRQ